MWKQMSEADQQAKWSLVTEILQVSLRCLKREGPAAKSMLFWEMNKHNCLPLGPEHESLFCTADMQSNENMVFV